MDGLGRVTAQKSQLPFDSNSFDVVISNGVINLIPDKQKAFAEIYRVLKPGGRLSIADIVLGRSISDDALNATIEAVKQNPMLAKCTFQTQTDWKKGFQSRIEISDFIQAGKTVKRCKTFTIDNL